MAYRLKRGKSIEAEVRRVAATQLQMAVAALRRPSAGTVDEGIHAARRHVKKVRAISRLVRDALGPQYRPANERLRLIGRMLAPLTDGEAMVDTLARLRKAFGGELPPHIFLAVRGRLLRRKYRVALKATSHRVVPTVIRLLRAEQRSVGTWILSAGGFRAVAPGLSRSYRGARKAMARAAAHPTADNYHAWRHRAKDHWLQLRLLEGRCNGALLPDQQRLETLDSYLGEYHNVAILQHIVLSDTLDSRMETASLLRLMRRDQRRLRHAALALGAQMYAARPGELIAAVRRHWRAAKHVRPPAEVQVSWRRTA